MTGDKKTIGIQNQTSESAPASTLLSRPGLVDPITKILAAVKEVKTSQAINAKASESMIGIVLMTSPPLSISVESFAQTYPQDTSFFKSVVQKNGKVISPKKDSTIIRAYCYIPEISGTLPLPDLKVLHEFLALWNESDKPVDNSKSEKYYASREKRIIKMYPDLYKEFVKVVMHPTFYKYVEKPTAVSPLQFVSVKFTDDFDTYHAGVLENVYSDFYKIEEAYA